MQMVSDEILDFWFLIIGIIVAVVVIIIAIWLLDRSRKHTPAYALGSAMQDAWAAKQAYRIRTGEAAPMPQTVEGLENIALESMQTKAYNPLIPQQPTKAQLDQQADDLAKKKDELDQQAPPV